MINHVTIIQLAFDIVFFDVTAFMMRYDIGSISTLFSYMRDSASIIQPYKWYMALMTVDIVKFIDDL